MEDLELAVSAVVITMLAIIIRLLSQFASNQPQPLLEVYRKVDINKAETAAVISLCNRGDRVARIGRIFIQQGDDRNSREDVTKMGVGSFFACKHGKAATSRDTVFSNGVDIRSVESKGERLLMRISSSCPLLIKSVGEFMNTHKLVVMMRRTGLGNLKRWTEEVLPLDGSEFGGGDDLSPDGKEEYDEEEEDQSLVVAEVAVNEQIKP